MSYTVKHGQNSFRKRSFVLLVSRTPSLCWEVALDRGLKELHGRKNIIKRSDFHSQCPRRNFSSGLFLTVHRPLHISIKLSVVKDN